MSKGFAPRHVVQGLLVCVLVALSACAPIYRNHGYVPTENELAQVQVGQTTQDELATLVGRPSSAGVLEGSGWYYVGSRWKRLGWWAPEEVTREVLAVSFDPAGRVSNIERYGLRDGNVIVLSRRVTEPNVRGIGLARQLLGSIGRIDAGQLLDN